MQIGNKTFPYPVLNNLDHLSGYNNTSQFELTFDTTDDDELIISGNNIILKNTFFKLKNNELKKLYKENVLKCALIVECSSSLFRKAIPISEVPKDIFFNIQDFKKEVFISAYMYATEDIVEFTNEDFKDFFDGYKIHLEKYNIVAIDDGFKFRIEVEPDKDNIEDSIFTIIQKDSNDKQLSYNNDSDKILIYLSPEFYTYYITIKNVFTNTSWAILVIPPLASCLEEVKQSINDRSDIEDIIDDRSWFKSVCLSYENVTKSKLTIEEFQEINTLELAQMVLNDATCNGLKEFASLLIDGQSDSVGGEIYE